MIERDMEKMLCYLADKVDRLEKERCSCNDNNDAKTLKHLSEKPPAHYPKNVYKTNYDEEEDCPSCSA